MPFSMELKLSLILREGMLGDCDVKIVFIFKDVVQHSCYKCSAA